VTIDPAELENPIAGPGHRRPRHRLRPAKIADLDQIMGIEQTCFTAPWPAVAMAEEIDGRSWSRVIVVEIQDLIVGFMVYWVVDPELHLLNLATLPEFRRQGVGRAMVERLLGDAARHGREEVWLEVRQSNAGARRLYGQLGFEDYGIRRRYYQDNDEDAVVMRWRSTRGDE